MNKCRFFADISDYLDGRMDAEQKRAFELHLSTCASCSEEFVRLKALSRQLKAWQAPQPGAGFESSVRNKIAARELERGQAKMKAKPANILTHVLIPSGVVVCLIAVIVTGVYKNAYMGRIKTADDKVGVPTQPAQPPAVVTPPPAVTLSNPPGMYQKLYNVIPGTVARMKLAARGDIEYKNAAYAPETHEQFSYGMALNRTTRNSVTASVSGMPYSTAPYYTTEPVPIAYNHEMDAEQYNRIYDNDFKVAVNDPLSTFSIDVDTASYSNVRRFLNSNQLPPPDAVRIEEMINYFTYNYPQPQGTDPFSINTEVASCPWNSGHKLALIGIQGKKVNLANMPDNNLVFLIDVSGSMADPDKLPLLKSSFRLLVDQLRANDRISIVTYAGYAGVLLDSVPGDKKAEIMQAIDSLGAGGSTAGAQGIITAYDLAKKNFIRNGNNRVILATDGDFNVGITSEGDLTRIIEERRKDGIFLTILGVGTGNYKDGKMEILADKGNGNVSYIDNILEAKKVMVTQLTGTLLTIAKDVKIQVEFNPAKVKSYRLIGYENRKLENRDFNDDKKDAGELGAGHTVTALYEIVPAGSTEDVGSTDPLKYQKTTVAPSDELLTVKLRYKDPDQDVSKLLTRSVKAGDEARKPSENFEFASSVAEFGMILRNSEHKGNSSYDKVLTRAKASKGSDDFGYRAEFIQLVQMAQLFDKR